MTLCPNCGHVSSDHRARGPLGVQLEPPRGYWRGIAFHLPAKEAAALHILVSRGEVSHLVMEMTACGENAAGDTAKTVIAHLRRRLPRAVRIVPVYGRGYKLEIDDG